jgi:O-antigen/teichoic acid export membrane protein
MQDDDNKREYLLRYSVKFTIAVFIAIVILGLLAVLFGNSTVVTWIFVLTWLVLMFFIFRGIYLMWFK